MFKLTQRNIRQSTLVAFLYPLRSLRRSKFSPCHRSLKFSLLSNSWSPVMEESSEKKSEDYPKPLSPPPPEMSRRVEYERAMRAEAAVKSGLALSRSDIIFEDQWIVVVNKPSGVYCEHVLSSMHQILTATENGSKSSELHLANRLDRDTSGVMIITKLHKVAATLVKAFTERKIRKTYLALCAGSTPPWNQIYIDSGHGRSKFGAWRVYSKKDVGRALPGGSTVRQMATILKVLAVNGCKRASVDDLQRPTILSQVVPSNSEGNDFDLLSNRSTDGIGTLEVSEQSIKSPVDSDSVDIWDVEGKDRVLLRAYPLTGRTHQIRLHSQYVGLPIRGDVRYEGAHTWKGTAFEGHALHAESLCFEHPVTGKLVQLYAPLPEWALEYLQ